MSRHARVAVDLDAVSHNVGELMACAPGSDLCAVVKADGYGHGAAPVARAALHAGAEWLAVALVEEGAALRDSGIDAPILLLSEPPLEDFADAFDLHLTPTVYHRDALETAARAAQARGGSSTRWAVHLKLDTGMHRVGTTFDELRDLAAVVYGSETLLLGGVFTHLATADDPARPETAEQLECFDAALKVLRDAGIDPGIVHAANSAATIAHPAARRSMVRCGISIYGIAPSERLEPVLDLRPAMSVTAEVTHILEVPAGEGLSYGLTHRFDRDTTVAVLPVGYADGVPRNFGALGGEVLIAGERRAVRGVVTMDQMMVELGPVEGAREDSAPGRSGDTAVSRGDEAVLIGVSEEPGGARRDEITAWDWARLSATIPYEVVCGFSSRLRREYP